jgi:hypothetical protein
MLQREIATGIAPAEAVEDLPRILYTALPLGLIEPRPGPVGAACKRASSVYYGPPGSIYWRHPSDVRLDHGDPSLESKRNLLSGVHSK